MGAHLTTKQYLAALKRLGLTPASKKTAQALGLSPRQCQRIAAGESAVPGPVALLLAMYLAHGLPNDND
jgi:hypothetical protein